jgi:hypothetical protein
MPVVKSRMLIQPHAVVNDGPKNPSATAISASQTTMRIAVDNPLVPGHAISPRGS